MFKRIKEVLEEEKARAVRELTRINERIREISLSIEELEKELKAKQRISSTYADIVNLRSMYSRIERLKGTKEKLLEKSEEIKERIRILERDLKSLEVVEERRKRERVRRGIALENLRLSYLHLIRSKILPILLLLLLSFPLFPLSATQERVKKDVEKSTEADLKELVKFIEKKIKLLREERRRLEELRKTETKREKQPEEAKKLKQKEEEIRRLVKAVNKADPDEIAPAFENLSPELAAEVLLRLKGKKAGQILANMNPEKAAKVMEIILKRNPDFEKTLRDNW